MSASPSCSVISTPASFLACFALEELAGGLTRGEARAIEQALIVRNPGYDNLINSIGTQHSWYQQAVDWGETWLRGNGFGL